MPPPAASPPRRPLLPQQKPPPRKKAARPRPSGGGAFPPGKAAPPQAPEAAGEANPGPVAAAASSPRLLSLDAFRGLTVAGMLLVNNAALNTATPAQFIHAEGATTASGITFADLIFPWFLLIVGVAIPFSAHGKREQTQKWWQRAGHVVERVVVLLALGMIIDGSIARTPLLTLGVLQLIGLAYGVARFLYAVLPLLVLRAAVAALLFGLYGASLVTDFATGAHFPWSDTANWVNRWNDVHPYHTLLNGLPSVWPTSALVLTGTVVGDVLRKNGTWWLKTVLLATLAGALWAAGGAWAETLPMSKPFWTPPYLLYAAGVGIGILAAFYLVTDAGENTRLQPFRAFRAALAYPFTVFGANPLVAYAGAILVKLHFLQEWHIWQNGQSVTLKQAALNALIARAGRTDGGWLYMAGYLGVWWVVCAVLYRKRIFLRA